MKRNFVKSILSVSVLAVFLGLGGTSFDSHNFDQVKSIKVDLDVH
ncbi:hypothetical protein [Macrococcus brunensis]|nr:hypothetical protein [Macrococcus brunensis]